IGTERHESRRIDNQLRGRAGRQGDPGYSRFYLSLDDNLMRIFASERVSNMMRGLGMGEGEAIEHKWVTNSIEKAQRKVEGRNFDIRKQLLDYDDVANDQRQIIYQRRNELMETEDISDVIKTMREDVVYDHVSLYIPPQSIEEQWDIPGLEQSLEGEFGVKLPVQQWLDDDDTLYEDSLRSRILEEVEKAYDAKCAEVGENMRVFEKQITLQILDTLWKEHLGQMDSLRQGIGLRGYGGKNPKQEYKREAFALFEELLSNLQHEVIKFLSLVQIKRDESADAIEQQRIQEAQKEHSTLVHQQASAMDSGGKQEQPKEAQPQTPYTREGVKVGRNQPCPCGSGKKYKQCHGKLG
ncbi:MAG: SEC-C metal-binding domain-containing protein, partial [Gammaproteobacteria bacterium]